MKKLFLTIGLLLLALPLYAQVPVTKSATLQWTITGDPLVPDVATAQSLIYRHYDDGATVGITLGNATCTGAGTPLVINCQVPLPAFTVGNHTVTVTAALSSDPTTESAQSNAVSFTFILTVNKLGNVTVKPGTR